MDAGSAPTDALLSAALGCLPAAVVVLDGTSPVWANDAARALVAQDAGSTGLERLAAALYGERGDGPVGEALRAQSPISHVVAIPADQGIISREVQACPFEDPSGRLLAVATFHPVATMAVAASAEREMVARLAAMLEHTTEVITVLDGEGQVQFSNAAAGRLTGFAGSSINGSSAFDLVHPDDRDLAAQRFIEALSTPGSSPPMELRLRYADDTWHDAEVHLNNLLANPDVKGIVVTIHDITDRKRDQELLRQSEARHRSLVQNLTDVIVVLDANFQVSYASPAIEGIISAPADTNIGMSAFNDIHPDDFPTVAAELAGVAAGPLGATTVIELRLESLPGSGNWRWIEAVAVNRLDDEAVCGIVCTLRDVTTRRETELELQMAFERERAAASRLRELDRLKDEFLSTVSHELRTPLTAIVGFSRLLADGKLDDEALEADLLRRLAANAGDMEAMVEQLLDFSSLEAGKVFVRPVPVDVRAVVTATLDRLMHNLSAHELVVEVPEGMAAFADADGISHIVRNLVTNAAKYSDPGTRITVRAWERGTEVELEVTDEGWGIPDELQERIFERFYRAPDAAHAGRRGSGVGLNVVKRYAEMMNGRVWVRSQVGSGTTFTVTLPKR
jgi:PAS domain S-box-containing protein